MLPLTPTDRTTFLEQGYLHVPDVVPREYCERVVAALCEFIAVDKDDPSTWRNYVRTGSGKPTQAAEVRGHPQGHGIVPLHHHQALWDVRQLPQIHALFNLLYDTAKLWVTLDRVSFKAPENARDEPFRMDAVHWDGDPHSTELGIQGLIYLTDNPPEQGAFGMVPGLYRELDDWLATPRSATEMRRPDVSTYPLVPLGGLQGSMVLWHRRMPHTSLANNSTRPRFVQYVAMNAAGDDDAREAFAALTREKRPPPWAIRQNVPGQLDPEPGPPVRLSELGRRLAGLDAW